MFDNVSLENTRFSPRSLSMNSIIVDLMQQRKFEVHTPFRFEAADPGTKTAREWATYAMLHCIGILVDIALMGSIYHSSLACENTSARTCNIQQTFSFQNGI